MSVSLGGELVRTVIALAVVAGSIWLLGKLARRRGMSLAKGAVGGATVVMQRHNLAKGVQLLVVQFGTRRLLIGVTPQNVSLLGEIGEDGRAGGTRDGAGVSVRYAEGEGGDLAPDPDWLSGHQPEVSGASCPGEFRRAPGSPGSGQGLDLDSDLATFLAMNPGVRLYPGDGFAGAGSSVDGRRPARARMSDRLEHLRELTTRRA